MGEEQGVAESRVQPLVGVHSHRHRLAKISQLHQKTRRQLRRISAAAPLRSGTGERDEPIAFVGGMLKKRIEEKLAKLELMQMLANIEGSNSHISHRNSHMQSTAPNGSLSQRRGLNVRRIAVDSRPVDTTPNAQTQASAVTVDKLQNERGSICFKTRSKPEQGTMPGDYQRVKTNAKAHDRKGKDRDSRTLRNQKFQSPSSEFRQMENLRAEVTAKAQPNSAIKIFLFILLPFRTILMMPVWIVLALFSSQPPWCPTTATPCATPRRARSRTRPPGICCQNDWHSTRDMLAFDALCEPWSP